MAEREEEIAPGVRVPYRPPDPRYRTIVADPPWPYDSRGGGYRLRSSAEHRPNDERRIGVGAVPRYDSMSMAQLYGIRPDAEDNAHAYIWTTNAFMREAHALATAWGFEQKTILTWGKVQPDGTPSMKVGRHFRGATEHCLFCVRGSLPLQTNEALPTLYLWPRLPHSVKPDAFYDLVEKASPGPYAELFARRARFGWDYPLGDQALGGKAA